MIWENLLENPSTITLPWVGGKRVYSSNRSWKIHSRLPSEHGWFKWNVVGNKARLISKDVPHTDILKNLITGYLVGDWIVPDSFMGAVNLANITRVAGKVFGIERGMDKFSHVQAGRVYPEGPLFFKQQEFPVGPESDVLEAFLKRESLEKIKGVPLALATAFHLEEMQRLKIEKAREKREKEIRRRKIQKKLGSGHMRRQLAKDNFEDAAKSALAIGGAAFLDYRTSGNIDEKIVRFRIDARLFECVCDTNLRIIDSGICLTDEYTGEKGDTYFTLESLPVVIDQAIRENKLVVFRHV